MLITICPNQLEWNTALERAPGLAAFTQSWEWGNILMSEGRHVERLVDKNGLAAQLIYTRLPLGYRYAFCPKGPIFPNYELFLSIDEYLKEKKLIFFRFEPPMLEADSLIHNSLFLIRKTLDINPRATTYLELQKNPEELLSDMHPKTRYNIGLAERKRLAVSHDKNLEIFLSLSSITARRDKFSLHSRARYQAVLASPVSHQLTIFSGDQPMASAVFIGFGNTFTYLYGASDHNFRSLMGPYLLQWEGILLGKKLGYSYYDFFGIAPTHESRIMNHESRGDEYSYDLKHQYAGATRFKLGFGGKIVEQPGTYDLIINPKKYRVYEVLRKIRRII